MQHECSINDGSTAEGDDDASEGKPWHEGFHDSALKVSEPSEQWLKGPAHTTSMNVCNAVHRHEGSVTVHAKLTCARSFKDTGVWNEGV